MTNLIPNDAFQPMIEGWSYPETRHRMENITVDKAKLIETLKENRDAHRDMFLKAQDVYRERMIAELERSLQEARDGGEIVRAFRLPVPEDHTEDFETAIAMLEWEQADTISLSHHDFMQYVQNQWGWRASFAANTQAYVAS